MMKYFKILILIVLGFASTNLSAQNAKKYVRKGNKQFDKGKYSEAEVQYRKALDKDPNSYKGKFNLGDAMYKQDNYKESGKMFNDLSDANLSPEIRAAAYYNLGNSLMKARKYQESINEFKQSLILNPNDYNAKYNLEYARKKLKDQQQQKKKNKNNKKNKNKQNQQKKEQQKKDQQNKEQQQQQQKKQKQQQNKQNQNDQQKQKQQQQPQQISKNDAQRMLEALKNDEKKTLEKLERLKAKAIKASKSVIDW